jgi:hypothetical protein
MGMDSKQPRPAWWIRVYLFVCGVSLALLPARASAQQRQSLDSAWWTGSLLAPSAATLPRGHVLVEPYLYDVVAAHSSGYGSRTFMVYGLADRVSVGLIPTFTYNTVVGGPNSSGIGVGDVTAQAQYRLTQFHAGRSLPTISMVMQETFPTGRFDQLGDRLSDGFGSGAWTTTLALYSQTYIWLANGRILRMRLNLSQAFSSTVRLDGASVYGTAAGFSGNATPGTSSSVDVAAEYSLTRSWVAALDLVYGYNGNTRVRGSNTYGELNLDSGSSAPFGFAPAIEYSWKATIGVIFGVRAIVSSRNTPGTITPAVAINIVR